MAHSIQAKLRGLVAAFVAVFAALALVPGAAFAADWNYGQVNEGTGAIVLQFGAGATLPATDDITVYKVADITLDSENVTDVVVDTRITNAQAMQRAVDAWGATDSPTAAQAQDVVDQVTSDYVFDDASVMPGDGIITISNLSAGVYYIEIADNDDVAYQNMLASVEPYRGDSGKWEIGPSDTVDDAVANVTVKSVEQGFEKTITADGAESDHVLNVGDTISYRIDFNVTDNMAEFWIEDQLTGADFQNNVQLHIVKGDNDTAYSASDGHFTVDQEGPFVHEGSTFKITLDADGIGLCLGEGVDDYYFTYDAKINNSASLETGVDNVAHSSEGGNSPANKDFAKIQVKKVDATDQSKVLEGAVFGLYSDADCNNEITRATTGPDGLATFDKILDPDQTYYVKEISAPAGYQINDAVFTVKVGADVDNGELELSKSALTVVTVTDTSSNKDQGIGLPTTGGPGTVALTAAGVVLVAGAAAFIVRSRKQD